MHQALDASRLAGAAGAGVSSKVPGLMTLLRAQTIASPLQLPASLPATVAVPTVPTLAAAASVNNNPFTAYLR